MAKKTPPEPISKNIRTLAKLDITYVPIDSVHPNPYNSNRQSARDFELLCRSMEEDGFTQPIIVNKEKNEIVDGEHRWRACKALGKTEIPIVFVDMTIEQQMISTLRHNRARGNEDINMASSVLRELDQMGSLDDASDSLLLDEIDLQIMLNDIPENILTKRDTDIQMTIEETEQAIADESLVRQARLQEDKVMSLQDGDRYTFTFSLSWAESVIADLGLGSYLPDKINMAEGLVSLCEKYRTP